MKMYILVRDDIPLGKAIVSVAHASLMCHLQNCNTDIYENWRSKSFKKVVCKVTATEFAKAKLEIKPGVDQVVTESTLDNMETVIVFCPREIWPKFFQYLRLYK